MASLIEIFNISWNSREIRDVEGFEYCAKRTNRSDSGRGKKLLPVPKPSEWNLMGSSLKNDRINGNMTPKQVFLNKSNVSSEGLPIWLIKVSTCRQYMNLFKVYNLALYGIMLKREHHTIMIKHMLNGLGTSGLTGLKEQLSVGISSGSLQRLVRSLKVYKQFNCWKINGNEIC